MHGLFLWLITISCYRTCLGYGVYDDLHSEIYATYFGGSESETLDGGMLDLTRSLNPGVARIFVSRFWVKDLGFAV